MSCVQVYSPPYLDAVMQNYCIRKLQVSNQMHSTCLIGELCFNNIVDKTFNHFCVLLCHMGFHRNTLNCLENAISLKKNSRLFNNVHFQYHKVSIMLLEKHNISIKHFCVLLDHMGHIYYSKFDKDQTFILFAEGSAYLTPNICNIL